MRCLWIEYFEMNTTTGHIRPQHEKRQRLCGPHHDAGQSGDGDQHAVSTIFHHCRLTVLDHRHRLRALCSDFLVSPADVVHERRDGVDLCAYAATQPWADGEDLPGARLLQAVQVVSDAHRSGELQPHTSVEQKIQIFLSMRNMYYKLKNKTRTHIPH